MVVVEVAKYSCRFVYLLLDVKVDPRRAASQSVSGVDCSYYLFLFCFLNPAGSGLVSTKFFSQISLFGDVGIDSYSNSYAAVRAIRLLLR